MIISFHKQKQNIAIYLSNWKCSSYLCLMDGKFAGVCVLIGWRCVRKCNWKLKRLDQLRRTLRRMSNGRHVLICNEWSRDCIVITWGKLFTSSCWIIICFVNDPILLGTLRNNYLEALILHTSRLLNLVRRVLGTYLLIAGENRPVKWNCHFLRVLAKSVIYDDEFCCYFTAVCRYEILMSKTRSEIWTRYLPNKKQVFEPLYCDIQLCQLNCEHLEQYFLHLRAFKLNTMNLSR